MRLNLIKAAVVACSLTVVNASAGTAIGVKYNSTTSNNEIYSIDLDTGAETLLKTFTVSTGATVIYDGPVTDFVNGTVIIETSAGAGSPGPLVVYDVESNTVTEASSATTSNYYVTAAPSSGGLTSSISLGDSATLTAAKSYAGGLAAMNMASSSISLSLGGQEGIGIGTGYVDGHSALAIGGVKSLSSNVRLSLHGSYSGSISQGGVGAGIAWGFK